MQRRHHPILASTRLRRSPTMESPPLPADRWGGPAYAATIRQTGRHPRDRRIRMCGAGGTGRPGDPGGDAPPRRSCLRCAGREPPRRSVRASRLARIDIWLGAHRVSRIIVGAVARSARESNCHHAAGCGGSRRVGRDDVAVVERPVGCSRRRQRHASVPSPICVARRARGAIDTPPVLFGATVMGRKMTRVVARVK